MKFTFLKMATLREDIINNFLNNNIYFDEDIIASIENRFTGFKKNRTHYEVEYNVEENVIYVWVLKNNIDMWKKFDLYEYKSNKISGTEITKRYTNDYYIYNTGSGVTVYDKTRDEFYEADSPDDFVLKMKYNLYLITVK